MNSLMPASLVHFYDTRVHRILCGVSGADHRSTKHSRSVTCHTCVGLLGRRPSLAAVGSPDAASGSSPTP